MDAKARLAHDAQVTRALMKLGAARREKLDKLDYEAYVEGLSGFSAEIVTRVCLELGYIAPEEFQPRFPPLYVIREQCLKATERSREARKALKAADLEDRFPPLAPDKWAEIREKFKAVLGRKVMP